MADRERPKKSLKDRATELLQDAVEALDKLFPLPEEPRLVPIPARRPIPRRR